MKRSICFFINNIDNSGGTERVTTTIANKLSESYKVYILCVNGNGNSYFYLNKNVEVISLSLDRYASRIVRRIKLLLDLKKFIFNNKIDILVNVTVYLSILTIPFKIFTKTKIISWEHFNYYYSNISILGKISRVIAAKYSDALIVLGDNDVLNYKKNIKGIRNIKRIYNPVSVNIIDEYKVNSRNVLSIGRLEEQKGFDMLLEAWKTIEDSGSEWNLIIVGNGSKEFELKNQIKNKELKRVKMLPAQKDVDRLYKDAGIFVLSSRFEGFGLVLIEAQANRLPIVSFDCKEGPKEIISDKVNGFLVKENNIQELADKVLTLINDEELRIKFSDNSQKDINKFSIDIIVNQWIKLINELLYENDMEG